MAMNLVEEQALERRERILETVRECIVERGVIELTIRDLARACRVSVPTLYRGFGSKEQLLVEAIRSFFNSEVLGDQLENTGLTGTPRLLAIVELCGKTIEEMPEYNQQLFTLFMTSDYGAQLGWDITESITHYVRLGLLEVQLTKELHDWIDLDVLSERVAAQCIVAAMEFCGGDLSSDGFTAAFDYSVALLMMAATTGESHQIFSQHAQQNQKSARRQYNERLNRAPGTIGESVV